MSTAQSTAEITDAVSRARVFLKLSPLDPLAGGIGADHADEVVLDLEAGGAEDDESKALSREVAYGHLLHGRAKLLRVNRAGTPWHDEDLAMGSGLQCLVVIPHVATRCDVTTVAEKLSERHQLIPELSPSVSQRDAADIMGMSSVLRAVLSLEAADPGSDSTEEALTRVRSRLALVSATLGTAPPLDSVFNAAASPAEFVAHVRQLARLGLGKLCTERWQVRLARASYAER